MGSHYKSYQLINKNRKFQPIRY